MKMKHAFKNAIPLSVIYLCASTLYAGLGGTIDLGGMIAAADVICCGKPGGLELVDAPIGNSKEGSNVWVTMRFSVDHMIKGDVKTNELSLFVSETKKSDSLEADIQRSGGEKREQRLLILLKKVAGRASTFTLVDPMNAMILVAPSKPQMLLEDQGVEARVEAEMIAAVRSPDTKSIAQVRAVTAGWSAKSAALDAALKEAGERDAHD